MNVIRFSHNYPKIHGQTAAKLVAIERINAEDIGAELKEYDTKYCTPEYPTGNIETYYKLPDKGEMLQLILVGNKGIPFCTIRRKTEQKEIYYKSLIGKWLNIDITEERT